MLFHSLLFFVLYFFFYFELSEALSIPKDRNYNSQSNSNKELNFQNQKNTNWLTSLSYPNLFKEDFNTKSNPSKNKGLIGSNSTIQNQNERTFLNDVLKIKKFFKDSKNSKFQLSSNVQKRNLKDYNFYPNDSSFKSQFPPPSSPSPPSPSSSPSSSTSSFNQFQSTQSYQLIESISGSEFFSHFDFFTDSDPTHGLVSYQNQENSFEKGLAFFDQDGDAVLKVDNSNVLGFGIGRDSVRLESKNSYSEGIIVVDVKSMPFGSCSGIWPAIWTYGKSGVWPDTGEIDIIESVEDNLYDQSTLHTSQGCTISPSSPTNHFTGTILGTDCYAYANQNSGCGIKSNIKNSYGSTFNSNNGGIFVLKFDQFSGITLWFFSRNENSSSIPKELDLRIPSNQRKLNFNLDSISKNWGSPYAKFSNQNCDFSTFIKNQTIVINTTLMGDWAGNNFNQLVQSGSCLGTQQQAVSNPRNYDNAFWKIGGIEVWQVEK